MKRADFLGAFLGYVIKKAPGWLPEEGLEEDMLDIIEMRLSEHNSEIKKVLRRQEERSGLCGK